MLTSLRVLNVPLAPGAFGKAAAERSGAAASRARRPQCPGSAVSAAPSGPAGRAAAFGSPKPVQLVP